MQTNNATNLINNAVKAANSGRYGQVTGVILGNHTTTMEVLSTLQNSPNTKFLGSNRIDGLRAYDFNHSGTPLTVVYNPGL
jgi:hypothetical protein